LNLCRQQDARQRVELPLKGCVPIRRHHRDELFAGLVLLVAGQVIRPDYRWLLSQRMTVMLA
jgi:hypothetical protein